MVNTKAGSPLTEAQLQLFLYLGGLYAVRKTMVVWGVQPVIPKNWIDFDADTYRTFAVLSIFYYMLCKIDPSNTWKEDIEKLLETYSDVSPKRLGFPDDWKSIAVWKYNENL